MSLARLMAAPTLAFFWFFLDMPVAALIIGTAAGITDLVDGIVARKLNQVTEVGALIDQLGDLVFESCCLLLAVMIGELWMGWLILYLFREFTVTVIRTYIQSHGGTMPSTTLGKAKSSLFQYAFFLLFFGVILSTPGTIDASWTMYGINPGQILVWIAIASFVAGFVVSFMSGWVYLKAFARFYSQRADAR
jgi:phosphatidylglycerophosphate synthase